MFLAMIAQYVYSSRVTVSDVMDLVLKETKIKEENNRDKYFKVIDMLRVYASALLGEALQIMDHQPDQKGSNKVAGWIRILDSYQYRLAKP